MQLTAILCAVATISTLTHCAPPHSAFVLRPSDQQAPSLQTVLLRAEDGTTFALRPIETQSANPDAPTVTITAQGEVIRGTSAVQDQQSPFIVVDRRQFESFAGAAASSQPQQSPQVVFLQRPETNAALIQSSDVRSNTADIVTLRATRIEPSREHNDQTPVVTIRRSDLEALIARDQSNTGAQQVTRVITLTPVTNSDNSQGFIFQTADDRQGQVQQGPQVFSFQAQAQPQAQVVRLTPAVTQQGVASQVLPTQHVAHQAAPQVSPATGFVPLTFPLHPLHSALAFPQLNSAASNPFFQGPHGPAVPVHQDQSQRRSSGSSSSSSRRDREREERNS